MYKIFKVYCDETNGNNTKQFVSEHLLTLNFLQVFNISDPVRLGDLCGHGL
jgi:hypothetical protein